MRYLTSRIGLCFVLAATPVLAESPFRVIWHGTGGWGDESAYCSLYDPKNVETQTGVITAIKNVTPMPGMREGLQMDLKTAKETIQVQLGPVWYLQNQDIK